MKAMIFAAGLGTRLKPFTDSHPKALAEVGGTPMLGLVIDKLRRAGVTEMVVNVHHFAGQIVDYIKANDNFGVTIYISDESDCLLDTGGGILAARRWLDGDEPFIVHNADILTDFDLCDMLDIHRRGNADVSLLTASRKTSRYLLFDSACRLRGWENISTGELKPATLDSADGLDAFAFGGVHVISPRVFKALDRYARANYGEGRHPFSVIPFYVDTCDSLKIMSYQPAQSYRWHDIGKPRSLVEANEDFAREPF
jgi:hypothetical protein